MKYEVIDRERHGGRLMLGTGVSIGRGTSIDTSCTVTIMDGAVVSDEVLILTHDHDVVDISRKRFSPLVIGKHAWVGARCIILESCRSIGDGAVIGAGSVVTSNVPAMELWAGNPACKVRLIGTT